jgi:uncharacterized protein (TIGR01777 family)
MRILLAGSSGFLGTRLSRHLGAAGHEVVPLVRRMPRRYASEVQWDPGQGKLDPAVVSTVDAVVNLSGANLSRRWTEGNKRLLIGSRLGPTGTLAEAIAAADPRPKVFLSSSGIDYYGDSGDRTVDETSPAGDTFLARLCMDWEAATGPAAQAGTRVVILRTAPVLDRDGGLMKPFLLQFRLFAGGRLGSGRQYMSWIAIEDWLGAVSFLLGRDDLSGPANLSAPDPVTNAEFTRALGKVLHRPTLLPVPTLALRIAVGEFGVAALASHRILPGVLTKAGFGFRYPELEPALRAAVRGGDH